MSISMALCIPLLTACGGGSGGNNGGSNKSETPTTQQPQDNNAIRAFSNTAKFTPEVVAHWQPQPVVPSEVGHSDETVLDMWTQDGKVLAFTKWHNGIIKVAKDAKDTTTEPEKFATLVTSQEHVLSSEDDIVSGASEHTLTAAQYI